MNDVVQVTVEGLLAFGARCDEHAGVVTGATASPPSVPGDTTATTAALSAIHAQCQAASGLMGERLAATAVVSSLAAVTFANTDGENADKIRSIFV